MTQDLHGYLLVHFVEDAQAHKEKIYLSLSRGDDPQRWRRLNEGEPILEWTGGTGGVRDPHIVRGDGEFFIVATDLRVWRPGLEPDWWEFSHRGSRDLIVWRSEDLVTWSEPWAVTVAPEEAGMAWAPETVVDPETGEYLVHWSSRLGVPGDPGTRGEGDSQILVARTRDFRSFSAAEPYLALEGGVIDMTVLVTPRGVSRFAKHADDAVDTMQVFQQVGSSFLADDFRTVATNLGQVFGPHVEAPLVFKANDAERWYLWVDQYGIPPQGYHVLTSTAPETGDWRPVAAADLELPAHTKHGAVLPLTREEHAALDARW